MNLPSALAQSVRIASVIAVLLLPTLNAAQLPRLVFETTSPYHHIKVIDHDGIRTLSFDGSMESRMSLADPSTGHFEYTELFHLVKLWQPDLHRALMIGLGGASIQRAFKRDYPKTTVETVELDPAVVQVAQNYFHLKESPQQIVHIQDGRVFLKRTASTFDVLIMDAYVKNRYGSFIPFHLATKEFFDLANSRLTENGVLAYNVIGSLNGYRADILGSMYRTLKTVFPQVYIFPARESQNVVLIATKNPQWLPPATMLKRANDLIQHKQVLLPTFRTRVQSIRLAPPPTAASSPLLTDDYAPVDGLLRHAGPR